MQTHEWLGGLATVLGVGLVLGCGTPRTAGPDDDVTDSTDSTSDDAAPTVDAAPTTVRFVALGDPGSGAAEQYAVAAAVGNLCAAQGCDFALLLGDNLYEQGADSVDDPVWQEKFEVPYASLDMPFYAVLGNHDYGGRLIGIDFAGLGNQVERGQAEVDYSAVSAKWRMPSSHYTMRQGPVGFIMLDTNSLIWNETPDGDQHAWWPTAVAEQADAPWLVVAGHHPYRSNGAHGNAGEYTMTEEFDLPFAVPEVNGVRVKDFFDEHVCGTAAIYLAGHDHNHQWLGDPTACGGTELLVTGAAGKVKALAGEATPARWQDDSQAGFLYVVADATTWTGRFVLADGTTGFEYTLTH